MLVAVLAFGAATVSAQSPWFITGEVSGNLIKVDKDNQSSFAINPAVGYMFNDRWGIMLDGMYGDFGYKLDGESRQSASAWGVGLGGVYKLKINDLFYYAPTLRVGYVSGDSGYFVGSLEQNDVTVNGISAGLNFLRFELRPSCRWSLNFGFGGLSWANAKADADDAVAVNRFDFNLGSTTSVGFTYYF